MRLGPAEAEVEALRRLERARGGRLGAVSATGTSKETRAAPLIGPPSLWLSPATWLTEGLPGA